MAEYFRVQIKEGQVNALNCPTSECSTQASQYQVSLRLNCRIFECLFFHIHVVMKIGPGIKSILGLFPDPRFSLFRVVWQIWQAAARGNTAVHVRHCPVPASHLPMPGHCGEREQHGTVPQVRVRLLHLLQGQLPWIGPVQVSRSSKKIRPRNAYIVLSPTCRINSAEHKALLQEYLGADATRKYESIFHSKVPTETQSNPIFQGRYGKALWGEATLHDGSELPLGELQVGQREAMPQL